MSIWVDESGQLFGESIKEFFIGAEVKFNEEPVGVITYVSRTGVAFVHVDSSHKVPVSEWNEGLDQMDILEVALVEHMLFASGGTLAMVINIEESPVKKNRFTIALRD